MPRHWFRHPHTTQEMRAFDPERDRHLVRGRRRPKSLPNAWDDIWRRGKDRSWKHFRNTQHKPVEI